VTVTFFIYSSSFSLQHSLKNKQQESKGLFKLREANKKPGKTKDDHPRFVSSQMSDEKIDLMKAR